MTAEAHIQDDGPWHRGIRVAVVDRYENGVFVHKFGQHSKEFVANGNGEGSQEADDSVFLHLSDDEGRALYEALAKHYGYQPDSPTLLREDYLAERKRVDTFIAHMTKEG